MIVTDMLGLGIMVVDIIPEKDNEGTEVVEIISVVEWIAKVANIH